jgi:hypothetical protein
MNDEHVTNDENVTTVQPDEVAASADAAPSPDSDTTTSEPAAEDTGGGEKLVPVSEARRYRKRAQAAESILADLRSELDTKDTTLEQQRQTIADLERSRTIDELLVEAGAIDMESTRLLTELALDEMDEPSIEQAVEDLRRRKPFLFRRRGRALDPSGAMSPRAAEDASMSASVHEAAAEASVTGRRQDLMRYLRLRRT